MNEKKKAHRHPHSGRKAEKKKDNQKSPHTLDAPEKLRNQKAFSFNSAVSAERRFRRKQDVETKKQHIPLVDRTPIEPPPILIAVVGPPKVGKTTLINSLIRLFTKSPITNIKGPITLVTGKKRRITLIECNNDINSMIDLAKVADLVLLLCDGSFGFEMEIFEFLSICQVHGMPRIMGILTHLDMIQNNKTLKNTKRVLKHRFWTEVYPGAKLFYLSGILHSEYLRNEIKNLGRFISIMKFRPLTWRINHSYLLVDRYEDLTNLELVRQNSKCDRNISLYGYVRGIALNKNCTVHIAGYGDIKIHDISYLPDPCPLPETIKKRALVDKEKLIYAPFSGVGGIVYDKDAVYVELRGSHSHTERTNDDVHNIVTNLIDARETLDMKIQSSQLQLLTGGKLLTANNLDNPYKNDNTTEDTQKPEEAININCTSETEGSDQSEESVTVDDEVCLHTELQTLRKHAANIDVIAKQKMRFENGDTDSDQEIENGVDNGSVQNMKELQFYTIPKQSTDSYSINDENSQNAETIKWKKDLAEKAKQAYITRLQTNKSIMKIVYGIFERRSEYVTHAEEDNDEKEIGGLFKIIPKHKQNSETSNINSPESSLMVSWSVNVANFTDTESKWTIQDCFVTGKWDESKDATELLKLDDSIDDTSDSDEHGDFEDLDSEEVFAKGQSRKRKHGQVNEMELAQKKLKLKEKFDTEYDHANEQSYYDELKISAEKQAQINKSVFENMADDLRVQIEGYRPGMYVRIEFQEVPSEFITNFDPTYPIIIGALNIGEENIGYVNVKIKKHRWYKRILKANDPIIVSLGWRRFQTMPLYTKLEDDLKFRYLKYTPEHLSCNAHFWGPITQQGTGFLALQTCEGSLEVVNRQGFRIAATGTVQELDKSTKILKKLKLVGYPMKIYKKTAFIKGMFHSALEVAKFEGAKIKTVSGIRGQIKKAVSRPEGSFRATFEDKIQLSDIVFCRTWYKINVQHFYTPVTTLLLSHDMKNSWKGLRTKGELKREMNICDAPNADSKYSRVVREPKAFKLLTIPKKLQHALPYGDKPNLGVKSIENNKRIDRVVRVKEPYEHKVSTVMKMIKTTYNHNQQVLKKQTVERLEAHRCVIEGVEANKIKKIMKQKKEVFRAKSKAQKREESKGQKSDVILS